MNTFRHKIYLPTVLLLVLALSALNTFPVLADDVLPPETEPVVSETPPAGETSQPETATSGDVLEQLPEGTGVIVLDQQGGNVPLASQAVEDLLITGDPIWCPAGVAPKANTSGCSPSFTSFTDDAAPDTGLIDWLNNIATDAAVSKAGVIWVAYNYNSAVETLPIINLNGNNVAGTMENFALTIQGGWNGMDLSKALDPNTPYSTFNVPFRITGWVGAVTINNILITNASSAGISALEVITEGNIVVNNVDIVNNTTEYGGAYLYNALAATGTVTVNDSTFNNNTATDGIGLDVVSKGIITIKNVMANGNGANGADLRNDDSATPKAINVNGTNYFNGNTNTGLVVYSKGIITLNNVTATGNTNGSGALLDNCVYNITSFMCENTSTSGVVIKGSNNFSDNGWDGLRVYSGGMISANNLTANGNGTDSLRNGTTYPHPEDYDSFGKGVFLHNYGALTAKTITLTGVNTFNNNASTGLFGYSFGAITVNNITANENGCDPLFDTDSGYCAGAYLEGFGVTQTGYGRFVENDEDGLTAVSYKGTITLNNLYIFGNERDGVSMCACGSTPVNVIIKGTNVFISNYEDGLDITSNGTVTLSNLTANWNGSDGVIVDNTFGNTTKTVSILGTNTFNNNSGLGLEVISFGAITTNALTAVGNQEGNGVHLDNCLESGFVCTAPTVQPITLNGNNYFDANGDSFFYTGLYVVSRGAITVNNLTSTRNDYDGAFLFNASDNAVGGVTIKGYAYVTHNDFGGLVIVSNGAVTLANITADFNGIAAGHGVSIENNNNPSLPVNVTITGNNTFNNNYGTGLYIDTYGIVSLNNLTANGNDSMGVRIDNNTGAVTAKPVTLTGTNTFTGNANTGLQIYSAGAIKVNNVMANYNTGGGNGVLLNNNFTIENQPITLTGYGIFNGNGNVGLGAYSTGNITLANLTANSNLSRGVSIVAENNLTAAATATVTITGINTFNGNGNGENGLNIFSDGAITLNNITANDNGSNGVFVDNSLYASGAVKNLAINGVNMFNGNNSDGLRFDVTGAVTLTRITANGNDDGAGDGSGIYGDADGNITLTCGSMYNNADYGYSLSAGIGKVITLKGVFTYGNPLDNYASPTPVITRTCPLP